MDRMVNSAAPKHMNMLVRRPAGRCLNGRSKPISPPRNAAKIRRSSVSGTSPSSCGRNAKRKYVIGKTAWILAPESASGAIDQRPRAARSVNNGNKLQVLREQPHGVGDLISFNSDNIVGSPGRTGQPNLPCRMIAFAQHAAKRNLRILKGPRMYAAIHHDGGRCRKLLEFCRQSGIENLPCSPVGFGFAQI